MKTKIAVLALASLLPLTAFSQGPTPPTPPAPPVAPVPVVPPVPPVPHVPREKLPKVPVTFLGVETSEVPSVVADQLGLAKGFGLVVDYVVPDGPAAAAGVQPNDILKMLNDQILMESGQLSKLIRSYSEGTTVTLTILRKGAETKLTAKLGKREVSQRPGFFPGFDRHGKAGENFGGLGEDFERKMEQFGEEMGRRGREYGAQIANGNFSAINETVKNAREQVQRAREQAQRAAEDARRVARGVRVVTSNDNGALKTTRIDLGKAQITYSDDQGEMKIETVDGKKQLTAKDAQGKLLFSGPVGSKEELEKVPAEVRQRFEKLEHKDLPVIAPTVTRSDENDLEDDDINIDVDNDSDNDNDAGMGEVGEAQDLLKTLVRPVPVSFPYQRLGLNTVLI